MNSERIIISEKLPMTRKHILCTVAVVALMMFGVPHSGEAGVVTGEATEWTQIANNAELVALVGKETQNVALNSEQLLTQVETLKTQLLSYQKVIPLCGDVRN